MRSRCQYQLIKKDRVVYALMGRIPIMVTIRTAKVCVDMVVTAGLGFVETVVCIKDVGTMMNAVVITVFGAGNAGHFGNFLVPSTLAEWHIHLS